MSNFPYPGLRPFERIESDIFFGREEHTDLLIDKLGQTHFLAVLGSSGCGKSSLVRTGLLASLETGFLPKAGPHWLVAELRPGNSPFTNLAKAMLKNTALVQSYTTHFTEHTEALAFLQASLHRGPYSIHKFLEDTPLPEPGNLLLLVDQFEEIFRYHRQDKTDELAAFVELLLNSSKHPSVYVVITMRSDFLGSCTQFYDLPEAISEGLFLTPRLTRDQLRKAVEAPARVFGGQVEPALVNRLLNEMGSDPDQLPLLQHALMRMWNLGLAGKDVNQGPDRTDSAKNKIAAITLSLADLEHIGKVENALSRHADEAYEELNPAQRKIAEILFCNLTEREHGGGRSNMRRAARLDDIATLANVPWEQVASVAEVFRKEGRQFLTPRPDIDLKPDSMLDISHESLIRQWQRMKDWTQQEVYSADIYRRLEDSACRWKNGETALWQTPDLENALAWQKKTKPSARWASRYGQDFDLAMRFLAESEAEHQKEQKKIEQERKRKLQRARKLTAWALFGVIVTSGLAVWGYLERNNALRSEQEARAANKKLEWTKKNRTISLFESQITHAALLARGEDYRAAGKILRGTHELDSEVKQARRHARNLLAWHNKLMGAASQRKYQRSGAPLFAAAVDSNGGLLATAGENGVLALFDVPTGRLLTRLKGHAGDVHDVRIHPQGKWAVSAGEDKQIIFWALPDGKEIKRWQAPVVVTALAISPNGTLLAIATIDRNISLRQVETAKVLYIFEGHEEPVSLGGLAFDSTGKLLASASGDGTARLWNVSDGTQRKILTGHTNRVTGVRFSPDDKLLATASKDKSVRLWETDSGEPIRVLNGHQDTVYGLRFASGGRYLISAGKDRTLRVWDVQSGVTMRVLQEHTGGIVAVATQKEPEQLFSASDDGLVRRWDMTLPYQRVFDLPSEPASAAIAPEIDTVAVGFADGSLRLYSLTSEEPKTKNSGEKNILRLLWEQTQAHEKDIQRLTFNPQGTLLASASLDQSVKLWRVKNGESYRQAFIHEAGVNGVSFSPDGHVLATACFDGQIGLLSMNTGKKRFFSAHEEEGVSSAVFNKDGSHLLTTGDYEVRLWNVENKPVLQEEYPLAKEELTWSVFSPDNKQIASVGRDPAIHIYSATGKFTTHRLSGHKSTLFRAIFSPDGQQIASVSADATVRFWDLHKKGSELFALHLPVKSDGSSPVYDFDFRCTALHCRVAVPLTNGKLMIYELGRIYD
ncbi:MAG: hypothetical protein GY862_18325 [Gammaproteobacteria bacterium]|nr:hypothetical protein [Gammaproteobacteria bacterium]